MDRQARSDDLSTTTYKELRSLARGQLARLRPGQTLQPTALVHDAWLRVHERHGDLSSTEERRHFFFAIGRAMRDVAVEEARRRSAEKRGGGARRQTLTGLVISEHTDDEVLNVHEALAELERDNPEHAQIVMLRFFGGLTSEETAGALDTSVSSVTRRWRFCRAWLRERLGGDDS